MMAGLCLIGIIIGIGFRKYDGNMRMVSTNSKAISAACHAVDEDVRDGYLLPVQWGVVSMDQGIPHCAFTTARMETISQPEVGTATGYA
jgi:hypothetical protein